MHQLLLFAPAAWAAKSRRIMATEGFYPAGPMLDAGYGQRWSKTFVQQTAAAARRQTATLSRSLGGLEPCRLIYCGSMQGQKIYDIIQLNEFIERVRRPVAEPPASNSSQTKQG